MTPVAPSLAQQAEALAAAGRVADGYAILASPAAARDAEALVALASWRLSGDRIRRDLAEARALFGRAADLGHAGAGAIHIAMLANGAGCERRWTDALARLARRAAIDPAARREQTLIAAMPLTADGDPADDIVGERIGVAPEVTAFRAFLSAEECRFLIDAAAPRLQPSVVVDPRSGAFIRDPVRTSRAAAFPFVLESPAVHAINRRIAHATKTRATQGEPLQLLHYRPGEQYKPHGDALPGAANQRVLTFLVWLNDAYVGGGTHFLTSGLEVRGRIGDAICFANVTPGGTPDPAARHAGLPVRQGEKLLLSRWIRAEPLDLSGPPGRPF